MHRSEKNRWAQTNRGHQVPTSIRDVLTELTEAATDPRDKGDLFERLVAAFLRTDPEYAARFSNVWMWSDWPDRAGKPDTGIDLVAEEREQVA